MQLSKQNLEKIFNDKIIKQFSFKKSSAPNAILIGGQPGCGKSAEARKFLLRHPDYIFINGDDLREFEPNYYKYLIANDREAADMTQYAVNYWVEKLIDHCADRKCNMIIEGTMRNSAVPIKTATYLTQREYKIDIIVMSVNYDLSLQSINDRYNNTRNLLGYARYTKKESHDEAYTKLEKTLSDLIDCNLASHINISVRRADKTKRHRVSVKNKKEIMRIFNDGRSKTNK